MDEQFSEELVSTNITPQPRKNFNVYLLIITIFILIISIVIIIILVVKLNDKTKKYDELKEKNDELNENYNKLNDKYSKQNDTLNDIFEAFQNFIFDSNISNAQFHKENYTNIKDILNSSKGLIDGTYDLVTKEPLDLKEGYQVAFETLSRNLDNYYTDEEYDNIVYKLSCLIGANADIGVYNNNPHISFYVKNLNLSLSLAALFNQKSIWDWNKSDEIFNTFHQPKFY